MLVGIFVAAHLGATGSSAERVRLGGLYGIGPLPTAATHPPKDSKQADPPLPPQPVQGLMRVADTGVLTPVGGGGGGVPLKGEPASNNLAAIDDSNAVFYYVSLNTSTAKPQLVGVSLHTAEILTETDLPFVEVRDSHSPKAVPSHLSPPPKHYLARASLRCRPEFLGLEYLACQ